ncbi:hypothetical protein C2D57_24785 [Escherichia coli]|nr:hypothetical protein [Escherichia coli]EFO3793465.1 hypothetical protein [Escherichia coli]RBJ02699.1 hypothetical protein DR106_20060 [Escherichia coli]
MEYRSRRLFDGENMPRKRLEGRSSAKLSVWRKIATTPDRSGKCARPVTTGRDTLAPGSRCLRATRGCG